jgi:uncharacterized membrane protein (DUF441 family)
MSRTLSERTMAPVAIGAIVMATALAALGTFADTDANEHRTSEFLVVCAIIAVAAAVVFGWIVPHGLAREASGAAALTLSILGSLTLVAFWSGLPPILAAGGALLGWAGRNGERGRGLCRAALVIGALALVADVAAYIADSLL